ncbi:hypothetical protein HNP52_004425 [Sphingomonas kyeonggiensis]|uniref:Uncharacterized protein n=1 Tax=Sphingomonas kyeonggiensis TaxID=1268553 RepID=A0A7W7NTW0_9SPHN|nr:hypothetical protein [Sphingomonas kyeonggiensis]MBB4841323.1 hypothetical protein [Sphingomonas kyeonggiensis]
MANPFLRRATEFIRDDTTFLEIVSPAPLTTFLTNHPRKPDLFDLPVRILGAPGSGKTMLAMLAEFRLVEAILRDLTSETNKDLAQALAGAGFLEDGKPRVAAVRVPMESEYRDFWELPYDDAIKTKLALWLVQARTMLALLRGLTNGDHRKLEDIRFIARDASEAQLEQIGGLTAAGIRDRALEVQRAIYSIGASLLPPKIDDLPREAIDPYQPFECIQEIEIDWMGERHIVRPVAMLDDVHSLHPDQFEQMFTALARREIKFGRWLMMRLDALSPSAVFRSAKSLATHNLKPDRDFIDVFMQGGENRAKERKRFREMAADMADRYLPRVQAFRNRNATQFRRLVPDEPPRLSEAKLRELSAQVDRDQRRFEVTPARRESIEALVSAYFTGAQSGDRETEVGLAMIRILMARYANRVSSMQVSLFEDFDPDPKTPLKADAGVAEAARLHLNELSGRALHYGFDTICDSSNENAELFLQLAGALVARMETQAIRGRSLALLAPAQQDVLRNKAIEIMDGWAFPFARHVRAIVDHIGRECREVSLTPNARLGYGANAIGILEKDIGELLVSSDELALVLKYAVAHGAIEVTREYGQGGKSWCLIEMSGIVCLAHGLTLRRGGFLERDLAYLREIGG